MNMNTEEIACDSQIARSNDRITEFYVDMNNPRTVTNQDQFGVDAQDAIQECKCGCNTSFENSDGKIIETAWVQNPSARPPPCPNSSQRGPIDNNSPMG
jgi:hypothetical protein